MNEPAGLARWFPEYVPVTDPVLIFAIVMTIILVAPILFARWRIPGLLGLIVAGAVVGPSVLGILERDKTMVLLGTVGLLYLMFVAGLELDMNQFVRYRARSVVFGVVSFLVPQVATVAVAMGVLDFSWQSALLAGAIIGSHTPVAYPIVRRLGITRNSALITAIGGTIVCDMLALVGMALVLGFHEGETTIFYWTKFVVLILFYVTAVFLGLPRIGRWFFRNVQEEPTTGFVFLAAILFSTAYAAHFAGLEPIIGAFLAGLALNRSVPEQSVLMSRVQFAGEALFIPFFLISVGMLVDVSVLASSVEVWRLGILFTVVLLAGKYLSAHAVCRACGNTNDESLTAVGLTVPHASAALAVTLIGFDLGFFDRTFVNAIVLVIFLSCFIGAWMVERYGRRVAARATSEPGPVSDAPQRIMVPLANPRNADVLMDLAFLIRDHKAGEPVYPAMVVKEGEDLDARVAESERMLGNAVLHAAAADVPVRPVTRIDRTAATGILRAAQEQRATTIVIGWSGHTAAHERIFGSTLDVLLHRSSQEFLVCRLGAISGIRKVVVVVPRGVHREPGFPEALRVLHRIAAQTGGVVEAYCDDQTRPPIDEIFKKAGGGVETRYSPLGEWSELMTKLQGTIRGEELLVLMSTRAGSLGWTDELERVPRLLARRLADANFAVYYPAEVVRQPPAGHEKGGPASALDYLSVSGIRVMEGEAKLEPAVRSILGMALAPDPAQIEEVWRSVRKIFEAYPSQISPGIALLHAHTRFVQAPVLLLGVSDDGISLPRTKDPAHMIFLLLNAAEDSAERHLQILAGIARLSRVIEPAVPELRKAASPEDVDRILRDFALTDRPS